MSTRLRAAAERYLKVRDEHPGLGSDFTAVEGWNRLVSEARDELRAALAEPEHTADEEFRTKFWRYLHDLRNIEAPCKRCDGLGVRTYSSSATWHGGCGGQAMTSDVCDHCWGSGDEHHHWIDLRTLPKGKRKAES